MWILDLYVLIAIPPKTAKIFGAMHIFFQRDINRNTPRIAISFNSIRRDGWIMNKHLIALQQKSIGIYGRNSISPNINSALLLLFHNPFPLYTIHIVKENSIEIINGMKATKPNKKKTFSLLFPHLKNGFLSSYFISSHFLTMQIRTHTHTHIHTKWCEIRSLYWFFLSVLLYHLCVAFNIRVVGSRTFYKINFFYISLWFYTFPPFDGEEEEKLCSSSFLLFLFAANTLEFFIFLYFFEKQ